jgi:hypothetical protein
MDGSGDSSAFSQVSKNAILTIVGKLLCEVKKVPLNSLKTLPSHFDDESKEVLANLAASLSTPKTKTKTMAQAILAYEDLFFHLETLSTPTRDSRAFLLCRAVSDLDSWTLATEEKASMISWLKETLLKGNQSLEQSSLTDSRKQRIKAEEYAERIYLLLASQRILCQELGPSLFMKLGICTQGEMTQTAKLATNALSSVINVDPTSIKVAISIAEANLNSPSASVRDSALNLLGAHISRVPEFIPRFSRMLVKGLKV